MSKLIGRDVERAILKDALKSDQPELIVVYGRRRVGKTFLIRNTYSKHIIFEFSGVYKANLPEQLTNFYFTLLDLQPGISIPKNWIEAFHMLRSYFVKLRSRKKKVIFIDEFPWLDSRKSGFLPAFDNFWNSFVSKRKDLIVVVCGSAASYMINKIVKNRGGLHNRLTQRIHLPPFNLYEAEQLLRRKGIKLARYDLVLLYMAMGGVPLYLDKIKIGESVPQIIDRLCFSKDGFLRHEFENVFASLFTNFENHESIIRSLAKVRKGQTRNEVLRKSKIKSGGTLTKTLIELEQSGFIENYTPYTGKKDSLYRLTDEYCLFYLKFIEHVKPTSRAYWAKIQGQPIFRTWAGFSFETICLKHINEIKAGLKISGIHSTHGSWTRKYSNQNVQIDLLIDRDDNVINLCEMKFYNTEFTLTKKYSNELMKKMNSFREHTGTKKTIFITFITTFGLADNQHKRRLVQNELLLQDLFHKI